METISIIDTSRFRVRVPTDLYPYHVNHVLDVQRNDVQSLDASVWTAFLKAGDSQVSWKSGLPRGSFFSGMFEERNLLKHPGPFLGAQTGTCITGPHEAPINVMLDDDDDGQLRGLGNGQAFLVAQSI